MQASIGITLSALLVLSLPGCDVSVVGAGSTIAGNGVSKEEKRDVAAFTQVEISATFEATVTIGPERSVTLNVDENLLKLVETRVVEGRLVVDFSEGPIVVANSPQKVAIVVPGLEVLSARGAAKVFAKGIEAKSIKVEAAGASSIELKELAVEAVDVKVEGAGRVTLDGKGKALALDASGASRFWAADAAFESAKVTISGAARCEVNVSDSITGGLSGACSLNVLGNPPTRTLKAVGASRVTF